MKHALKAAVAALFFVVAAPCLATVVNVDIDGPRGPRPPSATHSGDDGVLSSPGGTVWNGVASTGAFASLRDEFGLVTGVGISLSGMVDGFDPASTNDLQDTGATDPIGGAILELNGLTGTVHELAVYGGVNMGFDLVDANGGTNGFFQCASAPLTYSLPGTDGVDYCRFSNLTPFDLGGGVLGLRIRNLDGLITGLQLSFGQVPEPGTLGLLALAACLLGGRRVRRAA